MKKIILIALAVLLIIISIFLSMKYIEKKSIERHFNEYLNEHNYQNDVLSQKTNYDYKMGKFYVKVYYKIYPDREYHYYYYSLNDVSGVAYEKGIQIETTEYLEDVRTFK